jgi:uncharacterized phage-like protein YoqJ
MILGVTGHRPDKLGGYTQTVTDRLVELAIGCLRNKKPDGVITGMALGWDQVIAAACIYLSIPYIAAVPFKGQEIMWNAEARKHYQALLDAAMYIEIVSPGGFSALKMQKRNEWIVDSSDEILALWNGSSGGTCNCVLYAKSKKVPVLNCWVGWQALQ